MLREQPFLLAFRAPTTQTLAWTYLMERGMADQQEPSGLYHTKLLQDALNYVRHNGAGNPDLASRLRWGIDAESARYEMDKETLNATPGVTPSDSNPSGDHPPMGEGKP